MAEETKTEKKRSRLIFRIISRTAVVLAIAGCTISIVSNQSSIAEKKTELEQVQKQIDDLTDKIEEVFIRIYINNVKAIRPEALKMLELVIQCCEEVCGLMREFANFRRSKELKDRIIQINSLEEEADRLYIASMHSLHSEEKDVLAVIAWREIYSYLEKCADACEHAADVVESVVMKNS